MTIKKKKKSHIKRSKRNQTWYTHGVLTSHLGSWCSWWRLFCVSAAAPGRTTRKANYFGRAAPLQLEASVKIKRLLPCWDTGSRTWCRRPDHLFGCLRESLSQSIERYVLFLPVFTFNQTLNWLYSIKLKKTFSCLSVELSPRRKAIKIIITFNLKNPLMFKGQHVTRYTINHESSTFKASQGH